VLGGLTGESAVTAALVAGAVTLAALIKGALGFGFPPVATPLIASIVGAKTAVTALAIPGLLQNVVQAWTGRTHLKGCRPLLPLLASLVVGSLGGAYLLTVLPAHLATMLVGATVVVYALLAMCRIEPALPPTWTGPVGAGAGLVAGLLGGATGIFAPILVLYLTAVRMDKERFTAVISIAFFVGQVPQIAGYAGLGLFTTERLLLSALMIPPVAVGFALGTAVRSWMSQRIFAVAVRLALLVIGVRLIFEALR
jgi:uncharacterized membrane protein YfcA